MQGSVPGGTLCSNQLSKLCNKAYDTGDVYMYGGKIPIPPLAMVDDIVSIAICNSVESLTNNVKNDEFIKRKMMESQVGEGKCQWIHIGKTNCNSSYVANGSCITQASNYKYLGDHMSDGWDILYKKRYERAQSYSINCQAMCTEISLGQQLYSVARLLHQAIFLNGTLVNMETWPNFKCDRLAMFERGELGFFRKILSAHSKTPIECFYLELGVIPFRFHLMARRIMYFQTIMAREDDEITKKIVIYQKEAQIKGDFYMQVSSDLKDLGISETEITTKSSIALKEELDKKIKNYAFIYLLKLATSHSKVNESLYNDIDGMSYFNDSRFSPDLVNLLFKVRTRMFNVRNNFRNNYRELDILCPLCKSTNDTQEHLFECGVIQQKLTVNHPCIYEDVFSDETDTLWNVAKTLKEIVTIRENLIAELDEDEQPTTLSSES